MPSLFRRFTLCPIRITQAVGLIGLAAMAATVVLPRPAHAQVLFQQFYYPIDNPPAGTSWWRQASRELPALARLGVSAVWNPVPSKGGSGKESMGYDPYDLYDLGSKNQKGTVATRFGTKEEYLAYIAIAHANGLRVYSDVVLNHTGGADQAEENPLMARLGMTDIPDQNAVPPQYRPAGFTPSDAHRPRSWTRFTPVGADGHPGTGRFPRTWQNFHPSPTHSDRNPPYHKMEFGPDYCFESQNGYVARGMIAWGKWFRAQTGVDGFRMDAVRYIEPTFLSRFAQEVGTAPTSSAGDRFFFVGEFWDTNHTLLGSFLNDTGERMSLFDFDFFYRLRDMADSPGQFDMHDLLGRRNPNRDLAVTFVSNHDVDRSDPIDRRKRALPYAVMMTMTGQPSIFYRDYFRPEDPTLPRTLERLVRVHNRYAIGQERVRFVDKSVLALEREGNLLGLFNSGGDDGHTARTITVPTGFGKRVALRSVGEVGGAAEGSVRPITSATGAVTVTVPGGGYVLLVRAGAKNADRFGARRPLTTTQVTEFADDLDVGRLGTTPRTVRVTAAAGTPLVLRLRTRAAAAAFRLAVTSPTGSVVAQMHGSAGGGGVLRVLSLPVTGVYRISAELTGGAASGSLAITYRGPKTLP